MMFKILMIACLALSFGCAKQESLYARMGGGPVFDDIVDHVVDEIPFSERVLPYFEETNIERFRTGLRLHLCEVADGPCHYEGDSMKRVHEGMNISEADFNATVELVERAMTKAGVPYRLQNEMAARIAPMRRDIIGH